MKRLIPIADLSKVTDPKGRVDYLASKLLEQVMAGLPVDLQTVYAQTRPLIDGFISEKLGPLNFTGLMERKR